MTPLPSQVNAPSAKEYVLTLTAVLFLAAEPRLARRLALYGSIPTVGSKTLSGQTFSRIRDIVVGCRTDWNVDVNFDGTV